MTKKLLLTRKDVSNQNVLAKDRYSLNSDIAVDQMGHHMRFWYLLQEPPLTLYTLMDSVFWFITINLGCSIV